MPVDLNKLREEKDINILLKYAKRTNPRIREAVAANININEDIALILYKDKARFVRWTLAENPSCPLYILKELIKDKSSSVVYSVIKNPIVTFEIVNEVCLDTRDLYVNGLADKHPIMLDIAKKIELATNIKVLEYYAKIVNSQLVVKAILGHRLCNDDIYRILVHNKNPYIRADIASRKECPKDVLDLLKNDIVGYVKHNVAENPNTSTTSRADLSTDNDSFVLLGIAQNPDSLESDLENIISKKIKDTYVLHEVYHHKNCPKDFKDKVDRMTNEFGYMIKYGWH